MFSELSLFIYIWTTTCWLLLALVKGGWIAGTCSRISPFRGLDAPLWRRCHCFQWSLVKAHKIKTWKTKKESVYLGQGLALLLWLSQLPQAILLNPGIDQGSLYDAFPVLKCGGWEPGKDKGESPGQQGLLHGCCSAWTFSRANSAPTMRKEGRMKAKGSQGKRTECRMSFIETQSQICDGRVDHHRMASLARCRQF